MAKLRPTKHGDELASGLVISMARVVRREVTPVAVRQAVTTQRTRGAGARPKGSERRLPSTYLRSATRADQGAMHRGHGRSSATLVSAMTSDQKWKNVPLRIASTAHSAVAR